MGRKVFATIICGQIQITNIDCTAIDSDTIIEMGTQYFRVF
jgi:hypothetical protein